jgi:AraC family transcriptional regulator of adaptative response/methylated-DNA-[protein]-cysteine methyltransferase
MSSATAKGSAAGRDVVRDYARIEAAINYLSAHFRAQPELATVARAIGLSPYHFQRLFRRWAGISPKRFVQFLTLDYAKTCLAASLPVLETAFEAGLSGPGRLHDLFVTYEAMSPGAYRKGGDGITVRYGLAPCPFGYCWLGWTTLGLCALGFASEADDEGLRANFSARWPRAQFVPDRAGAAALCRRIFGLAPGAAKAESLRLHLIGTQFQLRVWEALLCIPPGRVASYEALAEGLGCPSAARAVGGALGANPISYLIPCHRVIRSSGQITGYEWGAPRKRALLAYEAAHAGRGTENPSGSVMAG